MSGQYRKVEEVLAYDNLFRSWEVIASKNPAPGIDGIRVSDFSRGVNDKLHKLHREIISGSYSPEPFISFLKEKKNHGVREITLQALRDKIVTVTLNSYLNCYYDKCLQVNSYAYRPKKGALKGVSAVERSVCSGDFSHVLSVDIRDFFDSIDHKVLYDSLLKFNIDRSVVDFCMVFVRGKKFDGISCSNLVQGVPQGLALSPFLSNVYLNSFDQVIVNKYKAYIRYADDMLIFANSADKAGEGLVLVNSLLSYLNLSSSVDKTRIYRVEEGFVFLGFLFTSNGKVPCAEAKERLHDKLNMKRYDDETEGEYLKRYKSIVRGWNNYYHSEMNKSKEKIEMVNENNCIKENDKQNDESNQPDDSMRDVNLERSIEVSDEEESLKMKDDLEVGMKNIEDLIGLNRFGDAISHIRRILTSDNNEFMGEGERSKLVKKLEDVYRLQGLNGAALHCEGKSIKKSDDKLGYGTGDIEKWLEVFGASGSVVYRQFVDRLGRHGYRPASKVLSKEYLKDHWLGRHTLAVSVYDSASCVRFGLLDLDISRKSLDILKKDELEVLKNKLLEDAKNVLNIAHKAGVEGVIEDSGYKGYHVWFFLYASVEAKVVKDFLLALNVRAGKVVEGTHREMFPASDVKPQEHVGNKIKMPLGIHKMTCKRSMFLTADGEVVHLPIQVLNNHRFFNKVGSLKNAVKIWSEYKCEGVKPDVNSSKVEVLFSKCGILRALKQKARESANLSHYERVVLRGILVPLGEEGIEELNHIMKYCSNYSRVYTDKMIASHKIFKPMGCQRIKEILSEISSKCGCNCLFKFRKNDYANPLRHLNARSTKKVEKVVKKTVEIKEECSSVPEKESNLKASGDALDNKEFKNFDIEGKKSAIAAKEGFSIKLRFKRLNFLFSIDLD